MMIIFITIRNHNKETHIKQVISIFFSNIFLIMKDSPLYFDQEMNAFGDESTTEPHDEEFLDSPSPSSKDTLPVTHSSQQQQKRMLLLVLVVLVILFAGALAGGLIYRSKNEEYGWNGGNTLETSRPNQTQDPDRSPSPTPETQDPSQDTKAPTIVPTAQSTAAVQDTKAPTIVPTAQNTAEGQDPTQYPKEPTMSPTTQMTEEQVQTQDTKEPTIVPTITQTEIATLVPPIVNYSVIPWEDICSIADSGSILYCDDGKCEKSSYSSCQVRCRPNSCDGAQFQRSVVECFGSSCIGGEVLASAALCEANSCQEAMFLACSCCDGDGCPVDVPSCKKNPIDFCSSKFLDVDCLAWENPMCLALQESGIVSREDTDMATAVICQNQECDDMYFESKSVLCMSACDGSTVWGSFLECHNYACSSKMVITNSTAMCLSGSCQDIIFKESDITCDTFASCDSAYVRKGEIRCSDGACDSAIVDEATVHCSDGSCQSANVSQSNITCLDNSCASATIDQSFVHCQGGSCGATVSRSVVKCESDSCNETSFTECSCCDGEGCPEQDDDRQPIQSCQENVDSFCSTVLDGMTCAERGNPLCTTESNSTSTAAMDVVPVLTADTCSAGNETVNCAQWAGCQDEEFESCSQVTCTTLGCNDKTFYKSIVECQNEYSCQPNVNYLIKSATFIASQVTCSGEYSCSNIDYTHPQFLACSCCDGDCPEDTENQVPSCITEDPTAFCNSLYLGRSCASWGSPVCQNMTISDYNSTIQSMICDYHFCRGMHDENVGVLCRLSDCGNADLKTSFVECWDDSCEALKSSQSTVSCRGSSCVGSMFNSSNVSCGTNACEGAVFGTCSCCDGLGCPTNRADGTVIERCIDLLEGENATDFCSSTDEDGNKCSMNPVCLDHDDIVV
jgi:hypothetical protein